MLGCDATEPGPAAAPASPIRLKGRSCSVPDYDSSAKKGARSSRPLPTAEEVILLDLQLQMVDGAPAGALYQKNGVWLDHEDRPIGRAPQNSKLSQRARTMTAL